MKTKTILLVEDNPSDAELAVRALHKNKVVNPIEVINEGKEALDYLLATGRFANRNKNELPGLVILDLNLPDISGVQVLKTIREHDILKELLVVILTSSLENRDVEDCYRSFANSYLRKPVDFLEFNDIVKLIADYWINTNVPPAILKLTR